MKKTVLTLLILLLTAASVSAAGPLVIKGVVLSDDGQPMTGAAVLVAGTTDGVIVDADGNYSISAAPDAILVFSSLGFMEVREMVNGRSRIDVKMKSEASVLNDAVVIGYGTQAKSDLTGSVSVVGADEIVNPAVTSIDQALQGRIAGVDVISGGGEPGAASTIRVRGTRSISAGNEPLIVVDGVMNAVESFSDINPDDIKSITVLKDASSTAIYGSRGANGVILVTTKGGDSSKPRIVFSASVGLSQLPRKLDVMDASQFAQWRNDYRVSWADQRLPEPPYPFPDISAVGKGTDWQDILTRNAVSQSYRLQMSRGDSRQSTYFSIAYDDNDGIVIYTGMKRVTSLLKLDRQLFKWMKVGGRVNYTFRHNDVNKISVNGTSSTSAVALSPLVGPYDVLNRYSDTADSSSSVFDSPFLKAAAETNYKSTNYLNLSPWVEIKPFKGLTLRSTYSFVLNDVDGFYYSPSTLAVAESRKKGGSATRSMSKSMTHLSESTVTWDRSFAKRHKINLVAGFTAEKKRYDGNSISGTGYTDDNVGVNNMEGLVDKRNLNVSTNIVEVARMSVLARANYSYASRYFLTLTGRCDGSSNFSAGNKWAFFPAAAAKWTVSNETWMSAARSRGLSNLALRLSVGRSGNDAISSYVSQSAVNFGSGSWLFGDNTEICASPSRLGDPTLTWEKTTAVNAGVDVSLFRDRITMTADAYKSYTSDLLLAVQNAKHTGYPTRYANIGDTEGWGVEFSIDSRNIVRPHFSWRTTFSMSHSTSIVTDLGTDYEYVPTYSKGTQMVYGYKKGYSANALWGYQYCGVWQNDAQREENRITNAYVSYSDSNGWSRYADVNHDGVLDKNDMVYLGSSDPVVFGGLQNTFNIFYLEIGMYLSYSLGGKIYNISEFLLGSGVTNSNKYSYLAEGAWHPVRNPEGTLPSAKCTDNYASDRFVHDSSYLRLKTLSVSYKFDMTKKIKWLRDISVGVYFDNLFLLTGYNGFDPDVTSSGAVQRLDNATYPLPRTYTFSVKIRY